MASNTPSAPKPKTKRAARRKPATPAEGSDDEAAVATKDHGAKRAAPETPAAPGDSAKRARKETAAAKAAVAAADEAMDADEKTAAAAEKGVVGEKTAPPRRRPSRATNTRTRWARRPTKPRACCRARAST
jgi:hypothetical protein